MTHEGIVSHFTHHKQDSKGRDWVCCPSHADMQKRKRQSLRISRANKRSFFKCWAGCTEDAILQAAGLIPDDVWYEPRNNSKTDRKIIAAFPFTDENGVTLFEEVRYEPKDFLLRRPDGKNGWIYNMKGVRCVLYNLPGILKAKSEGKPIFIVEGPKCANALQELTGDAGAATTTAKGAGGQWLPAYTELLAGCDVIFLPDNDGSGKNSAQRRAAELVKSCKSVKVLELPGLPEKGDIVDWMAQGHTVEEFLNLVKEKATSSILQSKGLQLTRVGDLLAQQEEAVLWVVEGLLPCGWLSGLFAKGKVGKSTFARHLVLSVARGTPFLRRATTKGSVVYISLEEKQSAIKRHFASMGAINEDEIYIFAGAATEGFVQKIIESVKEIKPILLIIDTLVRATKIKDVNNYAETTEALNPLLEMAHTGGCHVMFLHHTGKGHQESTDGDVVLGSTAIFGTTDISIFLTKDNDTRYISTIGRLDEDLPKTILTFDKTTKTVNIGKTKEEAELEKAEVAIREFLADKEPCPEKEIHDSVEGYRHGLKVTALRKGVEAGRILKNGEGGKKDPFRYSLPSRNNKNPEQQQSPLDDNPSQVVLVPPVPVYTPEQQEQESRNEENTNKNGYFSCSQKSSCSENTPEIREQENGIREEVTYFDLA